MTHNRNTSQNPVMDASAPAAMESAISLRDLAAAFALPHLFAEEKTSIRKADPNAMAAHAASQAYFLADALLKAR